AEAGGGAGRAAAWEVEWAGWAQARRGGGSWSPAAGPMSWCGSLRRRLAVPALALGGDAELRLVAGPAGLLAAHAPLAGADRSRSGLHRAISTGALASHVTIPQG